MVELDTSKALSDLKFDEKINLLNNSIRHYAETHNFEIKTSNIERERANRGEGFIGFKIFSIGEKPNHHANMDDMGMEVEALRSLKDKTTYDKVELAMENEPSLSYQEMLDNLDKNGRLNTSNSFTRANAAFEEAAKKLEDRAITSTGLELLYDEDGKLKKEPVTRSAGGDISESNLMEFNSPKISEGEGNAKVKER